jgi:octaprenyl-diphosphate synthase
LAFQIRDDLFDFGDNKSGKPAGLDIKEKKLTLPIIYALQQAPKSEGKAIKKLIRSKKSDTEKLSGVLQFVEQFGGMEYARKKMNELRSEAFGILRHLKTNPSASQHLEALVNFVIDRNS